MTSRNERGTTMRIPRWETFEKLVEQEQVTLPYEELQSLLHTMNQIERAFPHVVEQMPSGGPLDEADAPLEFILSFYPEGAAQREIIRAVHMPWPHDFFGAEGPFTPQPGQYDPTVWPVAAWQHEVEEWQRLIEAYQAATKRYVQEQGQKPLFPLPQRLSYTQVTDGHHSEKGPHDDDTTPLADEDAPQHDREAVSTSTLHGHDIA